MNRNESLMNHFFSMKILIDLCLNDFMKRIKYISIFYQKFLNKKATMLKIMTFADEIWLADDEEVASPEVVESELLRSVVSTFGSGLLTILFTRM